MKLTVRLTNLVLTADVEVDGLPIALPPIIDAFDPPMPPITPPPLPDGFASDRSVGLLMLVSAMQAAGLTPIGVQRHGPQIIAALKALYPALDVYLSPSDAPVWPGFGSLDVTIDSGKGGWSFRPDHATPWRPIGAR
jgi:hypothetical protein